MRPKETIEKRRLIATPDLEEGITDVLQHQVSNRLEFTAYDITFALRRRLSDIEVRHTQVRQIIHLQMRLIVVLTLYQCKIVHYDTASARRYVPVERSNASF